MRMSANVRSEMAKTRAIMTETERARIAKQEDVEDIKRYQAITRVRGRIKEELVEDVEVLEDHHPGLLDELREVVCEEINSAEDTEETPEAEDAHDAREPGENVAEEKEGIGRLEDFPDSKDTDDCLRAIHAARDFVKEEGPASMREIVAAVLPDHPLGYDIPELETGERYRGAWWRRIVQPGLEELDDIEFRGNYNDYQYVGDANA